MGLGMMRRRHHGAPAAPIAVQPEKSDVKDAWIAYANALGVDSTGTKAEIIERTTASDDAQSAQSAESDESTSDADEAADDASDASGA